MTEKDKTIYCILLNLVGFTKILQYKYRHIIINESISLEFYEIGDSNRGWWSCYKYTNDNQENGYTLICEYTIESFWFFCCVIKNTELTKNTFFIIDKMQARIRKYLAIRKVQLLKHKKLFNHELIKLELNEVIFSPNNISYWLPLIRSDDNDLVRWYFH